LRSLPLGYYELDATQQGDEERACSLVTNLNSPAVVRRRVVVILNADRSSREAFDALLKTLEEPKTPVTFILLASELKDVRLAGRSRCVLFRLRP
jgi:DNA polymerase III gamma/tau subunit